MGQMKNIDWERPFPRLPLILAWATFYAVLLAIAVGLVVTAGGWAKAHTTVSGMTFDRWCCSGGGPSGDCQPIPLTSVKEITGGYQVTLSPGDHPMVTRVHVYQMEESKVRWSSDGEAYACLYPNEDTLRCLYLPPNGS